MDKQHWHALTAEEALAALGSRPEGLSSPEAAEMLDKHGPNTIEEQAEISWLATLIAQLKSPLIYILLAAVAISFLTGHFSDGAVILVVVVINTIVGFVQEYRAERAMEELAKLAAPKARTRRDGSEQDIASNDVVPGDIVVLTAGDRVAADGRLLVALSLEADESALTGESEPAQKAVDPLPQATSVADRSNMVYSGTVVTRGRGEALVTSTGSATQFGRIASDVLSEQRQETPLQRQLARLGQRLGVLALIMAAIIFVAGILQGRGAEEMFLYAIAAAVAAVPEGLPAVVTIALAFGLNAMARRNALIRRLPAVEALGSATVIVSDKTGTLTQNRMSAREAYLPGHSDFVDLEGAAPDGTARLLLTAAALANDAQLVETDGRVSANGDPTEAALVVAAARADLMKPQLEQKCARLAEIPFESERGYMATLNRCAEGVYIFVKGAPEAVLTRAQRVRVGDADLQMDDSRRDELAQANAKMADQALRVLAVACRKVDDWQQTLDEDDLSEGLVHLGLIGLMDPPRPEAIDAVDKCRRAGIRVIMATGDNKHTARAIARDFRLISEDSLVVDGNELDNMSDEELADKLDHIAVFARVEPQGKLRVVKTLKDLHEVVAVTGDGVNDAPALKKADIGVAMGKTGTGVAREAGDMVLADDNFATIVGAVEEGRIVFERIQKVVAYLIATNAGELLTIAVAVAAGWPLPLTAAQLLWVNLVTDSGPSLALATDPPNEDVLARPPRDSRENVINASALRRLAIIAPVMAVVTLIAFWIGMRQEGLSAQEGLVLGHTMAFVTLSAAQLFNALNVRSEHRSVFSISPLTNKWLVLAAMIALGLQILPVQLPALQGAFRTTGLSLAQWGLVVALSSAVLWVEELRKLIVRLSSR